MGKAPSHFNSVKIRFMRNNIPKMFLWRDRGNLCHHVTRPCYVLGSTLTTWPRTVTDAQGKAFGEAKNQCKCGRGLKHPIELGFPVSKAIGWSWIHLDSRGSRCAIVFRNDFIIYHMLQASSKILHFLYVNWPTSYIEEQSMSDGCENCKKTIHG